MINQMLTKRVLPLVLGATALGWLDYKLGHPSDKAIDLGLKANVLRADLTDSLPGGRAVTDFYKNTVPEPQYGPLALPAAGAFVGGLLHYSRVLRGAESVATEASRKAGSLILPDMEAVRKWTGTGKKLASVEGLAQIWKSLGTPGKGAAIGLAMALPFIPGMLGARKTGGELRDIYSGEEQVCDEDILCRRGGRSLDARRVSATTAEHAMYCWNTEFSSRRYPTLDWRNSPSCIYATNRDRWAANVRRKTRPSSRWPRFLSLTVLGGMRAIMCN
jgi:hypothetical protein